VRLPKRRPEGVDTDFSMRSALRYFQTDRTLLALLLGIAGVGFGAEPSVTLAPPLVAELDARAEMVGVLTGGFGVGAAVGLILFSSMNRWISTITLSAVGVSVMAVGLAVVGSAPVLPMAVGGFGVSGFGYTLAITTMSALVQQRAPDHLRGRIMALWLMSMLGARPAAAALEGLIADLTSVRIAVFTPITALLAVWYLTRPHRLAEPDRVHEGCSVK
jgi:predicted MFS family arabinose efflux permease